jgi:hypothetical protein
METAFPNWFYILKKNILLPVFIMAVVIIAIVGCEANKEYEVDPLPVYSETISIDSGYTKVSVISTGSSDSLFCGRKDMFDVYSIMKFDTVPESFNSLSLRFASDTCTCELTLYKLKKKWDEDSVYLWSDIGSLIDTLNPIGVETMYPVPVDSPDNDTNSLILLGDSESLDESTIEALLNYGLAVHSNRFYSFASEKTRLKVETEDTLMDSVVSCVEDAYIVKNPFQDTVFTDSLLVGRGLRIRTNVFIPRDSFPPRLNKISRAELFIEGVDTMIFDLTAIMNTEGSSYTAFSYFDDDSLKFNLGSFFRSVPDDSVFRIQITAEDEINGIGVRPIGKIENSKMKFIWVEFP